MVLYISYDSYIYCMGKHHNVKDWGLKRLLLLEVGWKSPGNSFDWI